MSEDVSLWEMSCTVRGDTYSETVMMWGHTRLVASLRLSQWEDLGDLSCLVHCIARSDHFVSAPSMSQRSLQ